jgi:hypothetical protein
MEQIPKKYLHFKTLSEFKKMKCYEEIYYNDLLFQLYSCWSDRYATDLIQNINEKNSNCYLLICKSDILIEKFGYNTNKNLMIIGYVILYPKQYEKGNKNIRYIDAVQTFIPRLNLCCYMIKNIERKLKKIVIPKTISKNAIGYWVKYFNNKYNIESKNDMNKFLLENNLYVNLYDSLYET